MMNSLLRTLVAYPEWALGGCVSHREPQRKFLHHLEEVLSVLPRRTLALIGEGKPDGDVVDKGAVGKVGGPLSRCAMKMHTECLLCGDTHTSSSAALSQC